MFSGTARLGARGFSGQYACVNGWRTAHFSVLDLIRAFVTLGAAGWDDCRRRGWRNLVGALGDGIGNCIYLTHNSGAWALTSAFKQLDASHKGTVSYWLGMAFTKLAAERVLHVPWLQHVGRLRAAGALTTAAGTKSEGDLVGQDGSANWHVFEAKGRSSRTNASLNLALSAKGQAQNVIDVNGRPPATTCASVAKLFLRPVAVEVTDPDLEGSDDTITLEIDKPGYYSLYYRPIVVFLSQSVTKQIILYDLPFDVAEGVTFGQHVWLGMPSQLVAEASDAPRLAHGLMTTMDMEAMSATGTMSIGYDGVLVAEDIAKHLRP